VHNGIRTDEDIGGDCQRLDVGPAVEQPVGGGASPERRAELRGGAAACLGGFGHFGFDALRLGCHLEQRPGTLNDASGHLNQGFDALMQRLCGHGDLRTWPVRDRNRFATIGWILPLLHDPDGHEVRFYSVESHTTLDPDAPLTVDDAIATARVREAEWLAAQGSALRRSTDPVP
jgi:hypothetical protein